MWSTSRDDVTNTTVWQWLGISIVNTRPDYCSYRERRHWPSDRQIASSSSYRPPCNQRRYGRQPRRTIVPLTTTEPGPLSSRLRQSTPEVPQLSLLSKSTVRRRTCHWLRSSANRRFWNGRVPTLRFRRPSVRPSVCPSTRPFLSWQPHLAGPGTGRRPLLHSRPGYPRRLPQMDDVANTISTPWRHTMTYDADLRQLRRLGDGSETDGTVLRWTNTQSSERSRT